MAVRPVIIIIIFALTFKARKKNNKVLHSQGIDAWQARWNQLAEHFDQQAYGLMDEFRSVRVPSL